MLTTEDRLEILDLLETFDHAIDNADAETWLATWTSDGAFNHPSGPCQGTVELKEFIGRRNAGLATHPVADQRHWIADIELASGADGAATTQSLLLVSGSDRSTGEPVIGVQGRFRDVLRKTPDGWRFVERVLNFDYMRKDEADDKS